MNFHQSVIIKTPRLTLRDTRKSDAPAVFSIFSNPQVTEHYDCKPFTDEAQAENWVDTYRSAYSADKIEFFRWAITDNTDELIGSCGIHAINPDYYSLEIGYELHPDHWGMGLATEAVKGMLSYCFKVDFTFPINRVAATTDLNSPRSISVLNKLGFQEEGVLREYGYWKDRFHDVRLFSLLRKDFVGRIEE